jgi:hypothetical protein
MKKININSNITINWKIWRGVNKVEEDFVGSNLRVFLIGTENTYYLVPKAKGGVVTMTIAPGTLAAGSYDLKAIWEKNGGRTLMSSTRSNIFGITEAEEADQKNEVMQIVSYVESYGRDGLSAFEIAVLRGLHRGCSSEAEWINSLYAGGEGGGGGICMLGADIPIGGTALGDELLNGDNDLKLEGYLVGDTLSGGTPLNLLFKALLYRATEVQFPENVVAEEGYVAITEHAKLKVSAVYVGNRPEGYLLISVDYTPSKIAPTPPEITGLTWGYKDKDGNIVKDEQSVGGNKPIVTKRDEPKITVKVNDNDVELTNGEYRYTNIIKNNSSPIMYNVSVNVDEGKVAYTTDELFVWPLNSAYNTYDDGILEPAKGNAEEELDKLEGSASYTHPEVLVPNPSKADARAAYTNPKITKQSISDNPKVGKTATLTIAVTDSTLDTSAPSITGLKYGYKKDGVTSSNESITGTIRAEEITGKSVKVFHNGKEIGGSGNTYTFTVVEGENKLTAKYINPESQCTAAALTVTSLNQDGGDVATVTADGINKKVGGDEIGPFTLHSFDVVLPAYIKYYDGTQYNGDTFNDELRLIPYDGDEKKETAASGFTIKSVLLNPFYIFVPNKYSADDISVYFWKAMPEPAEYVLKNPTLVEDETQEGVPANYKVYKCSDSSAVGNGTYYITINTK